MSRPRSHGRDREAGKLRAEGARARIMLVVESGQWLLATGFWAGFWETWEGSSATTAPATAFASNRGLLERPGTCLAASPAHRHWREISCGRNVMTKNYGHHDGADLPPEDKMGFAVTKTRAHSLMVLNSYMRTDLLQHIHLRLHQIRDANEPGSPLHHMAKSLERVIDTY